MERNLEKESFWTFLEHKSEENGKVSNFLARTVPDGVKSYKRGGCGTYNVTAHNYFKAIWPDGVTKAVRVQILVTAQSNFLHDDVIIGSRQYDFYQGGELTASRANT